MIARSHPGSRRARVRTRPYARDGGLVERLIDDEIVRIGPVDPEGSAPLRAEEVAVGRIEDPTTWFASDRDVLESVERISKRRFSS